ncbi:MAG: methyltransferase domain-containing protein [Rhodobacter sp.]|nr:methyltransferase domain-containing protein [Rhodobacter sp.]
MPPITNTGQADYWVSAAGQKWIDHEAVLDAALAPMRDRILDIAGLARGANVLDIGCGTGDLTLAAAARAPLGGATGADISELLLARARARAGPANARFLLCDAQVQDFGGRYSHIVSRLGLMFFSDPVAAFRNLARAVPAGHRLTFAAWGPPARTLWFSIPKSVAEARLGPGPERDPRAPGPLAFQDLDNVTGLLAAAGWIDIEAATETMALTPGKDLEVVAATAAKVGPAVRIIAHNGGSAMDIDAIVAEIARRFEPYCEPGGLALPAAVNIVTCRTAST